MGTIARVTIPGEDGKPRVFAIKTGQPPTNTAAGQGATGPPKKEHVIGIEINEQDKPGIRVGVGTAETRKLREEINALRRKVNDLSQGLDAFGVLVVFIIVFLLIQLVMNGRSLLKKWSSD